MRRARPRPFRAWAARAVAAVLLAGWAVDAAAETQRPRHLIYLHGRIVQEEQSARPRHPQHGFYELEKILAAFRERGFVVSGEIRPRSASLDDSAVRVAAQVRGLLASGVSADEITVVGASIGARIALLASERLQTSGLRFALLGTCLTESVRALSADAEAGPIGRVLSIREASDDPGGRCPPWKADGGAPSGLVAREIILHTGLGHGFLYRPLPEWVEPLVAWAQEPGAAAPEAR
jgi:hypothetical protein